MNKWQRHLFTISAGILTLLVFYSYGQMEKRWLLFACGAVYLLALIFLYYFQRREQWKKGIGLLLFSALISLALLSVVESASVKWLLSVLGTVVVAYFFLRPYDSDLSPPQKKIWRRWRSLLITWDLLAMAVFIFAFSAFLPQFPFWLLAFFVSAGGAYLTLLSWEEYFTWPGRRFFLWLAVFFLLLWEWLWVIHLLPLGYLAAGVFVVWPWYVAELLVRFHLSPDGIIWRKQISFLIINLVLYIGLLVFFVKWI